jgi:hypothetical protein
MAVLDAAEAIVRENWQEIRSSYAKNYMTYAEALQQSGYGGNNGLVVLSKPRGGRWWIQRRMRARRYESSAGKRRRNHRGRRWRLTYWTERAIYGA